MQQAVSTHQSRWYQEECVEKLVEYCLQSFDHFPDGKPKPRGALICLPTGTGKSHVIAEFLKRAFAMIPTTRAVMATHIKELIKQNANKLTEGWPLAPLGFYSSGMNKAETAQPIIFGGIQSLVGKFPKFGFRNFLIIDEAHLLNDEGNYLKFINELRAINPYLIVIGLTATPYRVGLGKLTNGSIFTDIIYDLTTVDGFARLMAEDFLCQLIPKRGTVEIDTSRLSMSAGDYNQKQLQKAANVREITFAALSEAVTIAMQQNRKSWCVFATGIEHAESISEMLETVFNVPNVVIHSKKSDAENEDALAAWKSGKVKCAVNMNALTTGVDNPWLDLIICLRPTASTGLWVQLLGRGTRPFEGYDADGVWYKKENCLALDYGGNTRRLGPINDPVIPRKKGEGPPGDAPVRICGVCGVYNHARAVVCIACGTPFPISEKISRYADTTELIRSDQPQIEVFDVDRVIYVKHTARATGNQSIKACYYCGLRTFYEYQSVEANGFKGKRGRDWFRQRYAAEPPATDDEVLAISSYLRKPERIRVWLNRPYPEIMSVEF